MRGVLPRAKLGDPPAAMTSSVPGDPPVATPIIGGVATTFSKYGYGTASESEVLTWTTSPLEENNSILTKLLGEAFIRQASHARELKGLAATKGKLAQDNKILKQRVEDQSLKITQLKDAQKDAVEKATSKLKNDLDNVKKELKAAEEENRKLDEARAAAVRNGESLAEELAAMKTNQPVMLREAKVSGQVSFMKGFMRVFPDFDWSQMGEATARYAADLRAEMEEDEAARRAEEEVANRGEAGNQDGQNPPADP